MHLHRISTFIIDLPLLSPAALNPYRDAGGGKVRFNPNLYESGKVGVRDFTHVCSPSHGMFRCACPFWGLGPDRK